MCISLFSRSCAIYLRGGCVLKIYFIHLTYMLAKATTISHECIKQYGTKLIWSELLIAVTDCIKWSSFISAALAKPSCELRRVIYYWPVFPWTTTAKAAQFCCFTSNSGCRRNRGQQSLLVLCWAQITLYSFTGQISEATFPLIKMCTEVWSFPLVHSFAFYSKDCCHSIIACRDKKVLNL